MIEHQKTYSFSLVNFHPITDHDEKLFKEREKYPEPDHIFFARYERFVKKYGEHAAIAYS